MKTEDDILMKYNFVRDLEYTSDGDRYSKRKTFFTIKLPKLVDEIQNETFDENDLGVEELKKLLFRLIYLIFTPYWKS